MHTTWTYTHGTRPATLVHAEVTVGNTYHVLETAGFFYIKHNGVQHRKVYCTSKDAVAAIFAAAYLGLPL